MTNYETKQCTDYAVQEPVERFYDLDAYLVGSDATRQICIVTNEGYDVELVGVDLKGNRADDFESWESCVQHHLQTIPHLRHLINQPLTLI